MLTAVFVYHSKKSMKKTTSLLTEKTIEPSGVRRVVIYYFLMVSTKLVLRKNVLASCDIYTCASL